MNVNKNTIKLFFISTMMIFLSSTFIINDMIKVFGDRVMEKQLFLLLNDCLNVSIDDKQAVYRCINIMDVIDTLCKYEEFKACSDPVLWEGTED